MKRSGYLRRKTPLRSVGRRRTARLELAARGVDVALSRVARVEASGPPSIRVVRTESVLRAVEKPAPPSRSRPYLRFVAKHPCACCGATPRRGCDAAHWGPRGVSQKTDDVRTFPACRACHRFQTVNGYLPLDGAETITLVRARSDEELAAVRRLRARTRLLVAEMALTLIAEWTRRPEAQSGT